MLNCSFKSGVFSETVYLGVSVSQEVLGCLPQCGGSGGGGRQHCPAPN